VVWLSNRLARLKQVEGRIDRLFRQVLYACGERELAGAVSKLDRLVSAYPELRLMPQLERHPDEVRRLLARLDLDRGPLPGFEAAMERLSDLCLTPQAIHGLRSRLYTVAARAVQERPELLPTAAIAALTLDPAHRSRTLFTDLVICASAIEWLARADPYGREQTSLDVSTWLAAEPSALLLEAVGEERAYYYASIPGVLPFLDQRCVLFDARRLLQPDGPLAERDVERCTSLLSNLADRCYRRRLRAEIERARDTLRRQHPATSIAGVEMLTHRALQALDDLPPQVNPLLQAIWVQSWVHCLHELCG
jgi:hypothetical protein